MAKEGILKVEELIQHFCTVNNVTPTEYAKHEGEAMTLWAKRSQYQWTVDLGEYKHHVTPHK